MCSSTFGPAMAPSLVMWPISTIGTPLALAKRMSSLVHSRTCPTLPGLASSTAVCSVCMLSITTKPGFNSSTCRRMFCVLVSVSTWQPVAPGFRRSARMRTCWALSSPLT
jgi:hypothetical protein